MDVQYLPVTPELMESLNPQIIGEDNLHPPASLKDIDKLYHTIQLQALRIDELENRIRTLEQTNN